MKNETNRPNEKLNLTGWTVKKVKIVEVTIQLGAIHGIDKVPTSKIAKEAGVGEGTIYRHFRTKQDLVDTVVNVAVMMMTNYIILNSSHEQSLKNRCVEFCKLYLHAGLKYPDFHSILLQYSNCPSGASFRKYLFSISGKGNNSETYIFVLSEILKEAQKKGLIKDQPIAYMVNAIDGSLQSLLLAEKDGRIKLDNESIQYVANSCWNSLMKS